MHFEGQPCKNQKKKKRNGSESCIVYKSVKILKQFFFSHFEKRASKFWQDFPVNRALWPSGFFHVIGEKSFLDPEVEEGGAYWVTR